MKSVADDDARVVVAAEEETGEAEEEVMAGAKARPKAKGKAKPKRGRRTVRFEKCPWIEVNGRPEISGIGNAFAVDSGRFSCPVTAASFGDRLSCGFDNQFC